MTATERADLAGRIVSALAKENMLSPGWHPKAYHVVFGALEPAPALSQQQARRGVGDGGAARLSLSRHARPQP